MVSLGAGVLPASGAALCYRRRGSLMMATDLPGPTSANHFFVPFFFVLIGIYRLVQSFLRFGTPTLTMIWYRLLVWAPFWPVDGLFRLARAEVLTQNTVWVLFAAFHSLVLSPGSGSSHQGMDWGLLFERSWGGDSAFNFEGFSKRAHQGFGAQRGSSLASCRSGHCLLPRFLDGQATAIYLQHLWDLGSIVCTSYPSNRQTESIVLVVTFCAVMLVCSA